MNNTRIILINTPEHTNIGDHLIALGEYAFFHKYLSNYEVLEITGKKYNEKREYVKQQISHKDIIIITGGGFLGSLWQSGENVLDIIENFPDNRIIIFPQSMYFEEDETGRAIKKKTQRLFWAHRALFVCFREKKSFDLAAALFMGKVRQFLVPDMALILDKSVDKKERNGVLLCLRNDKESILSDVDKQKIKMILKEKNYYIEESVMHWHSEFDYKKRAEYVEKKIDELKSYSLVVTDTLHCMIICFISQIPCIALNNLTRKVEGVYEYCLKEIPYIHFCNDINLFLECLEKVYSAHIDPAFQKHCFDSKYELLIELITNISELAPNTAVVNEDKLYFTSINTPGVVYAYHLIEKKMEDMFTLPFSRAFLHIYKNELWLIPRKTKQIIIYNLEDKAIDLLPLDFINHTVFEMPINSIFSKPLQIESVIWLSSIIGLIKIDMKGRNYKIYQYSRFGFSTFNMAYTIQIVGENLYMFGEHCFVFNMQTETMDLWLQGKSLLFGYIDNDKVVSVPSKGKDKELQITDLMGNKIYNQEIDDLNLADETAYFQYWWPVRYKTSCFFLPYKAKGVVIYDINTKKFIIWNFAKSIWDLLEYKNGFLLIPDFDSTIFYYDENRNLLDTYTMKIAFDQKYELIQEYNRITIYNQLSGEDIKEWIYNIKQISFSTWNNESVNDSFYCSKNIWDNMNAYLGRK